MSTYICLAVLLIFQIQSLSQALPAQLNVQLKVEAKKTPHTLFAEYSGNGDEIIDGYLYSTESTAFPEAMFVKGGFNFLNENVFGGIVSTQSNKWIKNGFTPGAVESMTNGMDVKNALSFVIMPQQLNKSGDSLYILLKLARYDLKVKNSSELDRDYNVRLYYFLTMVPMNQYTPLPQISGCFQEQSILFRFTSDKVNTAQIFAATPPEFSELIKQSISKAESGRILINGDIQFYSCNYMEPELSSYPFPEDYLMKVNKEFTLNDVLLRDLIPEAKGQTHHSLYYSNLQFPFRIYDNEDAAKYEMFKSKDSAFRQDYSIILIPKSTSGDTVICDLFLSYRKISGAPLPRWTPIKKQLRCVKGTPIRIDLPKENWGISALLFGEKYEIYGYSDYERFVNDYLIITVKSITRNKFDNE